MIKKLLGRSDFFKTVVLILVGFCCYMYSIFAGDFAEWNIALPFLNFPIFIGEILLFLSIVLLTLEQFQSKRQYSRLALILGGGYIFWVLSKALIGYVTMGPLALRNAALFYYPFFFFIGFIIFERKFWNSRWGMAVFAFFCLCLVIGRINDFFILTYSLIALGFAFHSRHSWIRWVVPILVALHAYFSRFIFCSSRAHLVGMAVATVFLVFYFVFSLAPLGRKFKIGLSVVLAFGVILGLLKFGDRNTVRSLTNFNLMHEQFKEFDREVQLRKKFFASRKLDVELYNRNVENSLPEMIAKKGLSLPDLSASQSVIQKREEQPSPEVEAKIQETVTASSEVFVEKVVATKAELIQGQADAIYYRTMDLMNRNHESLISEAKRVLNDEAAKIGSRNDEAIEGPLQDALQNIVTRISRDHNYSVTELRKTVDHVADIAIQKIKKEMEANREKVVANVLASRSDRSLQVAFNNIYFRAFIWRDMMEELFATNPVFGVSFGQPQRSPSIEILEWASVEWLRDGWITPHNSFLHMIYRGGLVGLGLVLALVYAFINLTQRFLRHRSIWGGLLLTALVYWAMITNFLVFLEFPYNAIPFWTLLGMTWAYAGQLDRQSPGIEQPKVKAKTKKRKK